jgi:molybdopterin synthase catalytic subunit/molybdopterin converting factor small subunit
VDIEVSLFANLNKFLPTGSSGRRARLSVAEDTTIQSLVNRLAIPAASVHLVAINGRHQQDLSYVLHDGDAVSIFPPLAGGAPARLGPFCVGSQPIDLIALVQSVSDPAAGAVVTFSGAVRNHSHGKSVTMLEYEAYAPMAEEVLAQIAGEMAERWQLCAVAMTHRIGALPVGEISIIVAVSAAHRQDAFSAAAYAIDRVKEILPVWKKEYAEDGASWVEGPGEYSGAQETSV